MIIYQLFGESHSSEQRRRTRHRILTTEYRRLDGEKGFVRKIFSLAAEKQHAKVVRNAFIADLIEVCSTPAVFTVKFKA